ncbi:hypothetical protein PIB30_021452 [Stylosanthes scabra]|uniref:CCHC-type domain-containing protein n=1 Tax=Stylosanthes scabra TaxID=79078 RepID=A0ABU6W6V5_9FABA|nr:hypothetical protein [Stylosanthes scabra]
MRVTSCDRRSAVFVVEEVVPIMGSHQAAYRVRLRQRLCDCGRFNSFIVRVGTSPPRVHQLTPRRPISTRIRNDMDLIERPEKRCGLCRQFGHTRCDCPNAAHPED